MRDNDRPDIAGLVRALQFFTRIPLRLPDDQAVDSGSDLASAGFWFAPVGVLIGLVVGLAWWISASFLPALPAAALALTIGLLLTGALHEDGLADCADGLGGATSREKALEIMRDSQIGAYGAIAIAMTILLRVAALASLSPVAGLLALIIAHAVSRASIVSALTLSNYARKSGLGSIVSSGTTITTLAIAIALGLAAALLLGGFSGLLAGFLALTAAWGFLRYLEHRLGGYTGDGLGAMQQISEITVLLVLSGFWAG